ncbi:DUF3179 domain-containing protein [Natronorubrum aibiense]|uniref:DUF3179 domain-containing protein n=1 Tax=Natronorubrum aibiense TaxID=348826 RepID=A0A5P9P9C6_9EURY|nr:DUF3179 domain-containing protein [Natronorubrum aibiense]QFU84735.1 DUF3179 domain-containing protein [Natronorubrum aibiense]
MRDGQQINGLSRRHVIRTAGSVGLAALAGCLNRSDAFGRGADEDTSVGEPPIADRSLPEEYTTDELEDASLSGGPGQDGIPAIDEPQFISAETPPTNLADGDPVFGVELNGESKAYPQYILVWHEVVNDRLGGESVAVTYCPLTGTAQGFSRGDGEFGVSGRLINSNLVMFDRGTETWWPQILARGIRGPHEGAYLEEVQVTWTTWERWRKQHPETVVLTEETGHIRDYGADPYGGYNPRSGYYENENTLFSPLATDDRFPAKEVVVGARNADGSMAVPKATLRERVVVDGTMSDVPYVTVYDEKLDTGYVYRNPDTESVESDGGDITVDGDEYDADALPLEREIAFDAMWFAWYGYYPSTEVHE